ncbi:hypothetical protein I4U23_011060 [Adineta vaga]|nr:hypothetical protein I4U23_011060 [Adineta vaga]
MPEPNRPIEIRWLSTNTIENVYENILKPRWEQMSSKESISGIRDLHQFDSDINGFITCRRISQSNTTTTHKFRIHTPNVSTISRTPRLSTFESDIFIIIADHDSFRLAQLHSFDHSISLFNVSCFDPPLPASQFTCSKSSHLRNLIISTQHFRAQLIENPVRLVNDDIQITAQQLLDIQKILEED